MKIKIICVGKIKEKFYTGAIDEYMKIHGLGKGASLNIRNDFVGNKNVPSDAQAKIRITKLLAQLHNTKISVSIKGKAITDLSQ